MPHFHPPPARFTFGAAAALAIASGGAVCAQDTVRAKPHGSHGGPILFLVQATGAKTVPPSRSPGSATGAFIVDRIGRTVTYDVTYHGLTGAPRAIALRGSGEGANGALVRVLCDNDSPCPRTPEANLTGTWSGDRDIPLTPDLLGELASGRIYFEVTGASGRPEIRGQLEPNSAMVPVLNFVAHLTPVPGDATQGVGTAVMSEVHFANGDVSVFYQVTVADASGRIRGASLVGVASGADPGFREFLRDPLARTLRPLPSRIDSTGGTVSGALVVRRSQRASQFASKFLAAGRREVGIVVRTTRYPAGELYGAFRAIQ